MAGVITFWTTTGSTTTRMRSLIDGLVVLSALAAISWIFGLKEIFAASDNAPETAFGLIYPFGDTLILTVLLLSITRATRAQMGPMLLMLAGLGVIAIADAAFAYATAVDTGPAVAGVLNAGWAPGFMAVGLAAVWSVNSRQPSSERKVALGWQLAVPALAVWTVAVCLIVMVARGRSAD
ncbi:MAG TPA: hypothetical protein VET26_09785, partial [Candidatus Sulfotelmatobacter sp.]|nr:hypothetical protein [Candidatus Sulfotelmatobacter sp.]